MKNISKTQSVHNAPASLISEAPAHNVQATQIERKTLVLSPTVSITINACTEEFHIPFNANAKAVEAIGQTYYEKSEFWQAMRALPADLSGLDLTDVEELISIRAERLEFGDKMNSWRPQFATLAPACNAPTSDGKTFSSSFQMWQRMHTVRTLRANADALQAIHQRAMRELRKLGLDFGDLVRFEEYLGTFWLNESEEDIDAILRRSSEIAAEGYPLTASENQAAREFYEKRRNG